MLVYVNEVNFDTVGRFYVTPVSQPSASSGAAIRKSGNGTAEEKKGQRGFLILMALMEGFPKL
jgi:hypothetical protein